MANDPIKSPRVVAGVTLSADEKNLLVNSDGSLAISVSTGVVTGSTGAAATLTNVGLTTASGQVAAANSARNGLLAWNESTGQVAYISLSSVASSSSAFSFQIPAGGLFELPAPIYRGALSGVTLSSQATLRVSEY